METLGLIKEVGAYSERQYQKQDGTTEYFKSRGVVLKHGGDEVYGEMTGDYASKNRDTPVCGEGLLEASHVAGPERPDATRERTVHH